MSICPESDVCSLYIDGELSNTDRMQFEQHIKTCSKCKNSLNSYKRLEKCINYDDEVKIDLELSFQKLMLEKALRRSFLVYKIFYLWKKNKLFLKSSFLIFFFFVTSVLIISIRNRTNITTTTAKFRPIIPVACESHLPNSLKDFHFSNMTTSFPYERNMNAQTYKNIVNTFNGFSNLYSNLEHMERHIYPARISFSANNLINKIGIEHYKEIRFYGSLNKNAK